MNILICTVGDAPAFEKADKTNCNYQSVNRERLNALGNLLDEIKKKELKVDLVVMPAGYFASDLSVEKTPLLSDIWTEIQKREIAVCFGIDTDKKVIAKGKKQSNAYSLAWTPTDGCVPSSKYGWWGQRSITSTDSITSASANEDRYIHINGKKIAVLMCGEVFNRKIRVATDQKGIEIVVDMVHTGQHFRASGAFRNWTLGNPNKSIVMSCHTKCYNTEKRWAINGKYHSTTRLDIPATSPVRIEAAIITVP